MSEEEQAPREGDEDKTDYDYDFSALVTKMQLGTELRDRKTRLGKVHRRCFAGKEAVDWLLTTSICADAAEALHLLNRMLRRGHIHHVTLDNMVENKSNLHYRFAEDEYALLVERYEKLRLRTGSWSGPARFVNNASMSSSSTGGGPDGSGGASRGRHDLRRRRSSLRFGAVAVPDQWYDRVPVVPREQLEHATKRMVFDMPVGDTTRSLRTYKKAFTGRTAVKFMVSQGLADNAGAAVMFGNALMRAGVFHHVSMALPFTDSGAVYRLAEDHYQLLLEKYLLTKPRLASKMRGPGGRPGAKPVKEPTVASAGLGVPSSLELATASRYWTSYRASKLYDLNLVVQEAYLDMSDDWDSHVDGLFSTYCECYLLRDKEGTTHRTVVAAKSLHLVWHSPISFSDVDYLDTVRIDLKARTQYGSDLQLATLQFEAHEVMGCKSGPIVLEFECGSRQFVECAAAIITVQFDPQVAANVDGGGTGNAAGGDRHHHLLRTETLRELEKAAEAWDKQEGGSKRRGSKLSLPLGSSTHGGSVRDASQRKGSGHRGSIIRSSMTNSAVAALSNVYINVSGHFGGILLQELDAPPNGAAPANFSSPDVPVSGPMAQFSPWQPSGFVGPAPPGGWAHGGIGAPGQGYFGTGQAAGAAAAAPAAAPAFGGGAAAGPGGAGLPAALPAMRRGSGSRRPSRTAFPSLQNISEVAEAEEGYAHDAAEQKEEAAAKAAIAATVSSGSGGGGGDDQRRRPEPTS